MSENESDNTDSEVEAELKKSSLYINCVELLNLPLTKEQVADIIVKVVPASLAMMVSLCSQDFVSKMMNGEMMAVLGNKLFALLEGEHGIPLLAAQKAYIQTMKASALSSMKEHKSSDPLEQLYIDKVVIPRMEKYPDPETGENEEETTND